MEKAFEKDKKFKELTATQQRFFKAQVEKKKKEKAFEQGIIENYKKKDTIFERELKKFTQTIPTSNASNTNM